MGGRCTERGDLEAAEAPGMSGDYVPEIREYGIVAPAGAGRAQVRADAERAIVRNQQPTARASAPTTRKKAAHP
jgi:hypothetical protein